MKRLLARLKKDERGLTLVELLAVVVILAIVGGIAFVLIGNVIENSKKDAHVANALQLIAAAKLYEATTGKNVPATGGIGNGTGTNDAGALRADGLIEDVIDPWTKVNMTKYGLVTKNATTGAYHVTFETQDATKCNISNLPEAALARDGRKVCVAGYTYTP